MFGLVQGLMIALYPFIAENLKLNLAEVLFVFSLGSFMFIFGSPFWSSQSDRKGRMKILKIGLSALIISFFILAYIVLNPSENKNLNLLFLIVSRVIYGLVASAVSPVSQSIQYKIALFRTNLVGQVVHTKAMFLHSMSLSLGRLIGISTVILFIQQIKSVFSIYVFLLLAMFLLLIICEKVLQKKELYSRVFAEVHTAIGKQSKKSFSFVQLVKQINNSSAKWIMLVSFLFSCFMESLNSSLAGVIKHQLQRSTLEAGQLTANILFVASCIILAVQFVGTVLTRIKGHYILYVATLPLFIGSVIFAFVDNVANLWISVAVIALGIGLLPPLYMAELRKNSSDSEVDNYGRKAGIMSSLTTLGYSAGGSLSALLFRLGFSTTGFVLVLISLGIFFLIHKQNRSLPTGVDVSKGFNYGYK